MVASKRCKICAVLDANNVSISGEYFGKLIPDLILKVSGIELDSRKASGVLICQPCIIQLVHADIVIDKIRNSMQRLKKNVNGKHKTPLKNASAALTRDGNLVKNGEQQESSIYNTQIQEQPKNQKKVIRRKSVVPPENTVDTVGDNNRKVETPNTGNNTSFKKFADDELVPIKNTVGKPTKRKNALPVNETVGNFSIDDTDAVVKRNKLVSISQSEVSPMDLPVEENGCAFNDLSVNEIKFKVVNCSICGKGFHSKGTLRDHIETKHIGERLKACPHCSSEFRSQQKYESHVFSEKCKNANHCCQYPDCNKRFKTLHKLELHIEEKHSSQN